MRGGTEYTIESPRAPSTRRAAPASRQAIPLAGPLRFWATFFADTQLTLPTEERMRNLVAPELHEPGTVVERIHLDVSAPSARQGSRPGVATGHRGGVRGGTEATIESPRAPSTRRAARASVHATHVAHPQRFWATFYV